MAVAAVGRGAFPTAGSSDEEGTLVMSADTLKPRSPLGHYSALLRPGAVAAARVALARNGDDRVRHLADAVRFGPFGPRRSRSGSRMRGFVASPGGRLRWRSLPAPGRPGPAGAVVRPLAVATCDGDRAILLGRTPFPLPLHLGHECVAEVLEVGADVSSVRAGQNVVVPFQISCGTCGPCRQQRPGSCTGVPPVSMYGFGVVGGLWGGVLADLVAVPFADAMLVPLPDGIDPIAAASVADNVSDAYRTVAPHLPRLLARDPDTEVLMVGSLTRRSPFTSSAMLYGGLIAKILGARKVHLVDARPAVRSLAERLGLHAHEPDPHRHWPVAPLTVDATTTPSGLRRVLSHTAPDGICTCVWSLHHRGGFPLVDCYVRNVTLHIGRSHARTNIPQVLELMTKAKLRPELVTTNTASFDEAAEALRQHCGDSAIKTILVAK